MAAPTLQAEGDLNVETAGDNSPAIPTHQADDILVVAAGLWVPNSPALQSGIPTPADWNKAGSAAVVDGLGDIDGEIAWFWRRASGAGTTVTVARPAGADTGADTAFGARAYVIRGCATSGDPFDEFDATAALTAANGAVNALTVSGSERLAIQFLVKTDDFATAPTISGWTAGTQVESGTGQDHSQGSFRKDNVSASTSADASTVSAPAAGFYAFGGFSFKPPGAGAAQEVTPGALALAASPVAPRVDQAVAPAALVLTRTQVAPDRIDQEASPAAAARTLSPVAPRVDQEARPDAIALAIADPAPRIDQAVSPAAAALTLLPIAFARLEPIVIEPTPLALALSPVAPRVDQQLAVDAAARALSIVAPRVDQALAPDPLALAIAAVAPRIDQEVRAAALALVLAAVAPRIDQSVSPAALDRAIAALAPTRIDQEVPVGVLALTLAALAPTVNVAGAGDQSVTPDAIALTAAPVAPTRIDQALALVALALALTELGPDAISFPQTVSPAQVALALAAPAPRIDLSVLPAALARTIAALAPLRMDQTLDLINVLVVIGLPVPEVEGGAVAAPPLISPDPWFRRAPQPPSAPPIEAWSLYTNLIARYGLAEGRVIYERMLAERKGPFQRGAKYDPDRGTEGLPHIEVPKARRD